MKPFCAVQRKSVKGFYTRFVYAVMQFRVGLVEANIRA